jgi:molybdopterin synthase sulfur carrier subunit
MARVLFFGKLGDLAGGRARDISLGAQDKTVSALVDVIAEEDSVLAETLKEISIRCVVNEEMAGLATAISNDDEIAFLPPVSGG